MEKIKRILKKILCSCGFHSWIHIGDGIIFSKRYCENCRRQEEWCSTRYYRIKDISYIILKYGGN